MGLAEGCHVILMYRSISVIIAKVKYAQTINITRSCVECEESLVGVYESIDFWYSSQCEIECFHHNYTSLTS